MGADKYYTYDENAAREFEKIEAEAVAYTSRQYPLSEFKRQIKLGLTYENDEEQWSFDYKSYCLQCYGDREIVQPILFAKDYYRERWELILFLLTHNRLRNE